MEGYVRQKEKSVDALKFKQKIKALNSQTIERLGFDEETAFKTHQRKTKKK